MTSANNKIISLHELQDKMSEGLNLALTRLSNDIKKGTEKFIVDTTRLTETLISALTENIADCEHGRKRIATNSSKQTTKHSDNQKSSHDTEIETYKEKSPSNTFHQSENIAIFMRIAKDTEQEKLLTSDTETRYQITLQDPANNEQRNRESSKFRCDLCAYSAIKGSHLKSHMQSVHLKSKNFKCESCHNKFGLKHHLENHNKKIHQIQYN
jgi:5-methylcytosine-specific restriction endonuclease McrA